MKITNAYILETQIKRSDFILTISIITTILWFLTPRELDYNMLHEIIASSIFKDEFCPLSVV